MAPKYAFEESSPFMGEDVSCVAVSSSWLPCTWRIGSSASDLETNDRPAQTHVATAYAVEI